MYEAHFGFSGPPFQLVPDPGFFFGSRGHSNALAFLKSAAQQGEGFLVVTGEIGAGKTTLVRTLLEGLDVKQVKAATMVSTQLESGELPQAILLAFGASHTGKTPAKLRADLEACLLDLANQGRRALLIVDEAQNLGQGLIEELRLLSNMQLGAKALLQVFLVGQPDLRTLIQGKAMEQLRQRVTASCHLGPLDANETQAYVQHRLRRVGWKQRPNIEAQAYAALHQWTAGIPRRINRLCNRVLLAVFLEQQEAITAETVEQVARDLRSEIGEPDEQVQLQESFVTAPLTTESRPASLVSPPVAAPRPLAKAGGERVTVPTAKSAAEVPVTEEDEESDSRFDSSFSSDWSELPMASPVPVVQGRSQADTTGRPTPKREEKRGEATWARESVPNVVAAHEPPVAPVSAKRGAGIGAAPSKVSLPPAPLPGARQRRNC
jgi:general secretion pathway protein A